MALPLGKCIHNSQNRHRGCLVRSKPGFPFHSKLFFVELTYFKNIVPLRVVDSPSGVSTASYSTSVSPRWDQAPNTGTSRGIPQSQPKHSKVGVSVFFSQILFLESGVRITWSYDQVLEHILNVTIFWVTQFNEVWAKATNSSFYLLHPALCDSNSIRSERFDVALNLPSDFCP